MPRSRRSKDVVETTARLAGGPARRARGPWAGRLNGGAVGAMTALLFAAGCQTTVTKSLPTTPVSDADVQQVTTGTHGGGPPAPAAPADAGGGAHPVTADEAVGSAPSAARLHDISGLLLMYWALHQQLPAQLEDLRPLADMDVDFQPNAPSGQPYLYVPNGLVSQTATKRIIVADPAPSSQGRRWCILMPLANPTKREAVSLEVISMPEPAFRQYVPAE